MLQIITGKFFTNSERYRHPAKGVLYSNYRWLESIETCVGTLEPVDPYSSDVSTFVLSYINQIENDGEKAGGLVRCGDAEIVEQFRLLAMLGLRAYFAPREAEVAQNCRQRPRHAADRHLPSHFIPRFFDQSVNGTVQEAEGFAQFLEKVLSLDRDCYQAVIGFAQAHRDSLEAISYNLNLAYSVVIYALESLAQTYLQFEPVWEDYSDKVRNGLDPVLQKLDAGTAEQIRQNLLQASQLRLQKRFVEFVLRHTTEGLFRVDAGDEFQANHALRPSEVERALKNSYQMRSRYTHLLEAIPSLLQHPQVARGDLVRIEGEPYLTISGLHRLARHVLRTFVWRQGSLASQSFDWRNSLPGMLRLPMAPQYWLWKVENLSPSAAAERFSSFLEHYISVIREENRYAPMTDFMRLIEQFLPGAKPNDQMRMLAMFGLFNSTVVKESRAPGWEAFFNRHAHILESCSIESMLFHLLLGQGMPWSMNECENAMSHHFARRFHQSAVRIPRDVEIALLAELYNMGVSLPSSSGKQLLQAAILEATGNRDLQAALEQCLRTGSRVEVQGILLKQWDKILQADPKLPRRGSVLNELVAELTC